MFPEGAKVIHTKDYINPFNKKCSDASLCPRGMLDYKCQMENKCYTNLAELGLHLLFFIFILIIFLVLLCKWCSVMCKFFKSAGFVSKFIGCVGSCLKVVSLGVFGDRIYY